MTIGHSALPARLRETADLAVLDVTKWFGETSGGVRTYLLQKQAYVTQREQLRHTLVIPGERDDITDVDGTRTYRLRGPHIPTQKPYRFLLATRSLSRIVHHERPDVIEVGSPFLVPWLVRHAVRRLDIPLVNFYHSNFPRLLSGHPARTTPLRHTVGSAAWQYVRQLDRVFHTTIVASDFSARELANAGIERTVRVPLGVDLAHFHPRRRASLHSTRRQLGLPESPIALFVGRFAREKELPMVIDAWRSVERKTDATLVLAGNGPLRPVLEQHARGHRVVLLPYLNDRETLANLFAAADLYVAPSSIETFGLAALEALASGTPLLSANRGGVAEHVHRSGAGAVFESGCAGSLAEAAVTLLNTDLAHLGARGRAYAEREHDWEVVFDRLFAVYRTIVRTSRSPSLQ